MEYSVMLPWHLNLLSLLRSQINVWLTLVPLLEHTKQTKSGIWHWQTGPAHPPSDYLCTVYRRRFPGSPASWLRSWAGWCWTTLCPDDPLHSTPLWSPLSSAPCRTFGPDSAASTSQLEGSSHTVKSPDTIPVYWSKLNWLTGLFTLFGPVKWA